MERQEQSNFQSPHDDKKYVLHVGSMTMLKKIVLKSYEGCHKYRKEKNFISFNKRYLN